MSTLTFLILMACFWFLGFRGTIVAIAILGILFGV